MRVCHLVKNPGKILKIRFPNSAIKDIVAKFESL